MDMVRNDTSAEEDYRNDKKTLYFALCTGAAVTLYLRLQREVGRSVRLGRSLAAKRSARHSSSSSKAGSDSYIYLCMEYNYDAEMCIYLWFLPLNAEMYMYVYV